MLGNTIPEMHGDIHQVMLPGISPDSIAGCEGATDTDCIPESIPVTIPDTKPDSLFFAGFFDKRNSFRY